MKVQDLEKRIAELEAQVKLLSSMLAQRPSYVPTYVPQPVPYQPLWPTGPIWYANAPVAATSDRIPIYAVEGQA